MYQLRYRTWEVEIQFLNLPHTLNTIFKYCPAAVNLENVEVLYLEDGDVYRPELKITTATMFFLKKPFLVKLGFFNSKSTVNLRGLRSNYK